jgi:threonine aldolase
MAAAEVGDDVYGEDPSALRLQERVADLLGKEAALFVPSGTMANQLALLVHCERGNDVLVGEGAHCALLESGAGAAWAQVNFTTVGRGGLFSAEEMVAAIKPPEYHFPQSRLCAIENTHNRAGGRVFPQAEVERIAREAHAHSMALHLDGARIWNASIATGLSPKQLAAPADTVSACFSKGLGAPVGSILAAGCGRSACCAPRRTMRSITTSSGWPRIIRTRAGWPRVWPRYLVCRSTWRACRPIS